MSVHAHARGVDVVCARYPLPRKEHYALTQRFKIKTGSEWFTYSLIDAVRRKTHEPDVYLSNIINLANI